MALFKVFRGQRNDLDSVTKVDGHAYFCTDDGSFWIDYLDAEGTLYRKQVNEKELNEIRESIVTNSQSDWNQVDPTAADFIKNKPFYTDIITKTLADGTYTSEVDPDLGVYITNVPYTESINNAQRIDFIFDEVEYPNLVITDLMDVLGCVGVGNLSFLNPLIEMVFGENPNFENTGEPFVALAYLSENLIRIGTDFTQSTTHSLNITVYEAQDIKMDEKYLPDSVKKRDDLLQEQIDEGYILAEISADHDDYMITLQIDPSVTRIEWGDGEIYTRNSSSETYVQHTYIAPTSYLCKIFNGGKGINSAMFSTDFERHYLIGIEVYAAAIKSAYLADGAFSNQSNLEIVKLDYSPMTIGNSAFRGCQRLKEIVIPEGVTTIGWNAFDDCSSLTEVVIPDSVTTIDDWAFYNCSSLTKIVIPNKVTSIQLSAFQNCTSLVKVIFNSVTPPTMSTSVEHNIFKGCTSLSKIFVPAGSIDAYKAALPDYADIIDAYAMTSDLEGVATETYVQDYVAQNAATILNIENGEGVDSIVQKVSSEEITEQNCAVAENSTALGVGNITQSKRSFVGGNLNKILVDTEKDIGGSNNFVYGNSNIVVGSGTITAGVNNTVGDIDGSISGAPNRCQSTAVFGQANNIQNSKFDLVSGYGHQIINSEYSTALGDHNTINNKKYTTLIGNYLTATRNYQTIVGANNDIEDVDSIFAVAWGGENRFTVNEEGVVDIGNILTVQGTTTTKYLQVQTNLTTPALTTNKLTILDGEAISYNTPINEYDIANKRYVDIAVANVKEWVKQQIEWLIVK